MDLSQVHLHPYGIPPLVQTFAWFDPVAVTWGNDIYFDRGAYNPRNINSSTIERVAHELTHVAQFNRFGKAEFARWYLTFVALGRIPHPLDGRAATYAWNPLEWEANAGENLVTDLLREQRESSGEDLCH
jgi:hypothetical protein